MIQFIIIELGLISVIQGNECPKCDSQGSCYKLLNAPWPQQMGCGHTAWFVVCLYWGHQQNGEEFNMCIVMLIGLIFPVFSYGKFEIIYPISFLLLSFPFFPSLCRRLSSIEVEGQCVCGALASGTDSTVWCRVRRFVPWQGEMEARDAVDLTLDLISDLSGTRLCPDLFDTPNRFYEMWKLWISGNAFIYLCSNWKWSLKIRI